ncbi:MAG: cyclic 2,3-diphosphoglycerate synthase [Desulfobacteraceae bacterium]|jgi:predicted GTPase
MIEKVIIMGAAGRDFHNFNVYFKENPRYDVVAFTATQIPDIDDRRYPPQLAGKNYPNGIPIHPEKELMDLIRKHRVDLVAFSYSDISHQAVMHQASQVMAAGADFILIGATYTMLRSTKPVISVCAVRTGCGKSPTTRHLCRLLQRMGQKAVVVRHPMPYGDLTRQVVQRFASYDDFSKSNCTIEEREEYEPLVDLGMVVYAGVDYEKILRQAEAEADVVIWDGGNNDTPFYYPDIHIVVFDPLRAGHERQYYPGETNLLMADIAIINKVDSASKEQIQQVVQNIVRFNPKADIVMAQSAVTAEDPRMVEGKRVLVVEDGPTLTHGEMAFGAGFVAAQRWKAAQIVSPKPHAVGRMADTLKRYPHIDKVIPAMGYSPQQIKDLEATINGCDCDLVLFATPIDLPKLVTISKPTLRVHYEYQDHQDPTLEAVLKQRLDAL